MLHRISCACCLFFLAISSLLTVVSPTTASASNPKLTSQDRTLTDFPAVDPNYIYNQLFYMVTSFLALVWRPLRRTLVLHQVYSAFIAHEWHGCDRLKRIEQ